MILVLRAARAAVSGAIFALAGIGFLFEGAASRLTGAQKFLTKELERRGAA